SEADFRKVLEYIAACAPSEVLHFFRIAPAPERISRGGDDAGQRGQKSWGYSGWMKERRR
ncbi:MAG: hypothetical protein ACFNTM_03760, partial [Cardiobacterium sp.]